LQDIIRQALYIRFIFKHSPSAFQGCGYTATRVYQFGGTVQKYNVFSRQYVYAGSENHSLEQGSGCTGNTTDDPLGVTFDEVYNNSFH
jgi:hypothetical protein